MLGGFSDAGSGLVQSLLVTKSYLSVRTKPKTEEAGVSRSYVFNRT